MSAMRGFGIFYVLLAAVIVWTGISINTFEQIIVPTGLMFCAGLLMVLFDVWLEERGA